MVKLPYLIESQQFDKQLLFSLFNRAEQLRVKPENTLNGKVLATLFYEPSTRTRLSFESAMLRMGGSVLSTENAKEFSSAIKGESLEDSIRVICAYSDCIVMRHYEDDSAQRAVNVATKPFINAGSGRGQHPTQALLDLYTIHRELGKVEGITVAMVGDLANGRTVHSLSYLLGKFDSQTKIIFVSPPNLRIPENIKEYLVRHNITFSEETDFSKVLPIADVIYMTRIQKERMTPEDYELAKGKYCIDSHNLGQVRPNARIMHPLPHVEEINIPIEIENNDLRIAYFRQAENGIYVRMALLEHLMK
ncbi:MAG: aspartate carbamoyltransferase [archaeon]|jgi:aspartate carbamoyltransferase catalytic subunit